MRQRHVVDVRVDQAADARVQRRYVLLAALANQASAYTVAGHVAARQGNRHPSIAPYEIVDTADGQLALAVGNDKQFAALCAVLGCDELATDQQYATNTARVRHRDALRTEIGERLSTRPLATWVEQLSAAGVPAGPVNDIAAAFSLAERLGLNPTVELQREDGTTVRLPRNPIGLSATPATYRSAPPPLDDGCVRIRRAVGEVNEVRDVLRRCVSNSRRFDDVELLHTDT